MPRPIEACVSRSQPRGASPGARQPSPPPRRAPPRSTCRLERRRFPPRFVQRLHRAGRRVRGAAEQARAAERVRRDGRGVRAVVAYAALWGGHLRRALVAHGDGPRPGDAGAVVRPRSATEARHERGYRVRGWHELGRPGGWRALFGMCGGIDIVLMRDIARPHRGRRGRRARHHRLLPGAFRLFGGLRCRPARPDGGGFAPRGAVLRGQRGADAR